MTHVAGNVGAFRFVQVDRVLISSLGRQFSIPDRRQAQAIDGHLQMIEGYPDRNRAPVLAITVLRCELTERVVRRRMATASPRFRRLRNGGGCRVVGRMENSDRPVSVGRQR